MNILTIIGTPHKGNTRKIVDLFLDEFRDGDDIENGVAANEIYNYSLHIQIFGFAI